ncbi:MAG: N-acetyl-gamma-glutamyl-phosphate reductase [Taibaiella sp.]
MIRAGIMGAAGYTGGELIRLILNHSEVAIAFAHSNSQAGKRVCSIHQDLIGETDLMFTQTFNEDIDVLFLCLGHNDSRRFLLEYKVPEQIKIIDLSQDFRLHEKSSVDQRAFVYGLPELNRDQIKAADSIANPGCFATAIQLGLLPLIKNGFNGNVYSTGITGATGAGQSFSTSSHFAWRSNNVQAYKSLNHQHMLEIKEHLKLNNRETETLKINFIPWRGDFARGIFVSQQLQTDLSIGELNTLYHSFYSAHPFTSLSEEAIHLKQVVHTNKCLIQIEQVDGQTVIHSMIDNLLKGASGQAIQNMNVMFGINETHGLKLKAGYF